MSFNATRFRALRLFHNHTQRSLGERVGVTASTITKYESGKAEPKGVALDALGIELRANPSFFFDERPVDEFLEPETNFRSRTTASEKVRKRILAHATLFAVMMEYMGTDVAWPALRLPKLAASTHEDLERAAEKCRFDLGIGIEAPIENVAHLTELAGAVIATLDASVSSKIDAFSRYGKTNLVVLNPARNNAARTRFDLCHEIAHGVLHRETRAVTDAERKAKEDEAEYFAGALALPRAAFSREFWALGLAPSWHQLGVLKQRWGVHFPAIIVRAFQLGMIDAAEYQRRFKYMAKCGWLRVGGVESYEVAPEPAQLFSLGLAKWQTETGKNAADLADELSWKHGLFREVTGVEPPASGAPNVSSFEAFRQRKMAAG